MYLTAAVDLPLFDLEVLHPLEMREFSRYERLAVADGHSCDECVEVVDGYPPGLEIGDNPASLLACLVVEWLKVTDKEVE